MSNWKLLASGPTLEAIQMSITRYFSGEEKRLYEVAPGVWLLAGPYPLTLMRHYRVVKDKKRLRFELEAAR